MQVQVPSTRKRWNVYKQYARHSVYLIRPKAEYEPLVQQYDEKYSPNDVLSDVERYKCNMGRARDGTV